MLASVGLGCMILNVFCFAVAFGLNGTIESFISREYGSGNYKECGAWLNRGRTIVIVVLIPTAICFFFMDSILVLLKQDPAISKMARDYVVWSLPGALALVQFDSVKRFLQSLFYSHISTQV